MKLLKLFPAAALLIAALLAGSAPSATAGSHLILWGRHNPANTPGPRLQCNQLELNRAATVEALEGTARSYCLLVSGKIGPCGGEGHGLLGKTLAPGVYSVLPGLSPGQDRAYIRMHLKYLNPS